MELNIVPLIKLPQGILVHCISFHLSGPFWVTKNTKYTQCTRRQSCFLRENFRLKAFILRVRRASLCSLWP